MVKASREFQVFVKPGGSICNLDCQYCYYLKKEDLYSKGEPFRMPDAILEDYIIQHIAAFPGPVVNFSWHGGEPIILGVGDMVMGNSAIERVEAIARRVELHAP